MPATVKPGGKSAAMAEPAARPRHPLRGKALDQQPHRSGLEALTLGVWEDIQQVFTSLESITVDGRLDLLID